MIKTPITLNIRLYFIGFFIILFSSQFVLRKVFLYPKIQSAERKLDENSIHIFKTFFNEEIHYLERIVSDYGFWDEFDNYMEGSNDSTFINSNFIPKTYESLNIDVVSIYDKNKNLIWNGKIHEENNNKNLLSEEKILDDIDMIHLVSPLPAGRNRVKTTSGFTLIDKEPYFFASSLITSSTGEKEFSGYLLFLKKIDDSFFGRLASKINMDIKSINLLKDESASYYISLIKKIDNSDSIYKYQRVRGSYYIYYKDNRRTPVLFLKLTPYNYIPMDYESFILENVLSFFSIFIFMLFLEKVIKKETIVPIIKLNNHIKRLKVQNDYSLISHDKKRNEIDYVIHGFNSLLKLISDKDKEIKNTNKKLYSLANNDGLTGIANRRAFNAKYELGWRMSLFYEKPITVIMCDIDKYKQFNDFYGHQKGDDVLKTLGTILKKLVRSEKDIIARYGGEEFILFFYDCDIEEAVKIATRLRELLKLASIPHEASDVSNVLTISMGICSMIPHENLDKNELIKSADNALYLSKENGRDRYSISNFVSTVKDPI